jgi:hypothetical protein
MKLIKEYNVKNNVVGNATCERCKYEFELTIGDLFLWDSKKIAWRCENCKNINGQNDTLFESARPELNRIAAVEKAAREREYRPSERD